MGVRRSSLTLAGNRRARRAGRLEGLPQGCPRHRLEGANQALRLLSSPQRRGQEATVGRGRDRARAGRLPVGYRAGGRTVIDEFRPSPLHRAGGGPRWGTPVASYVAEPIRSTPALWSEDCPETKTRKAVPNLRMRV